MIYLTSDQHFNHTNIIRYCSRPFTDVNMMNDHITNQWNNTVNESTDHTIILGDFALNNTTSVIEYLQQLRGTKELIIGNHDSTSYNINKVFTQNSPKKILYHQHYKIGLSHYPFRDNHPNESSPKIIKYTFSTIDDIDFLLCGHIHEKWQFKIVNNKIMINVGVDVWDFKPVALEQLIELYQELTCQK